MNILHVVGARPNFMKVAPVVAGLNLKPGIQQVIVHTGQHYDKNMSTIFFGQLGIPEPDINLEVGSGSHAQQTAQIISRFESVVLDQRPDLVLVYGDVNSTVAAALVCSKMLISVGHVEAGLRSFDRTMPEEINRLLTDQVADLLFTPSEDGNTNLARENIAPEKVHLVGNVMIDTLVRLLPRAEAPPLPQGTAPGRYGLVTLHRPSNVDAQETFSKIWKTLEDVSRSLPIIFPLHPRTRKNMQAWGIESSPDSLHLMDPVGYLEFLALQKQAALVITDSGGIQEETTYLGVPCLTVRENTERPVTVELGTNILVGHDVVRLSDEVGDILSGNCKKGTIPPLWDGRAGERIAEIINP